MDVTVGRYAGESQRRRHLRLCDATGSAVRHRERCRHAERREDHVLSARGAADLFVESKGELSIGVDDNGLMITTTIVSPVCAEDDRRHGQQRQKKQRGLHLKYTNTCVMLLICRQITSLFTVQIHSVI